MRRDTNRRPARRAALHRRRSEGLWAGAAGPKVNTAHLPRKNRTAFPHRLVYFNSWRKAEQNLFLFLQPHPRPGFIVSSNKFYPGFFEGGLEGFQDILIKIPLYAAFEIGDGALLNFGRVG